MAVPVRSTVDTLDMPRSCNTAMAHCGCHTTHRTSAEAKEGKATEEVTVAAAGEDRVGGAVARAEHMAGATVLTKVAALAAAAEEDVDAEDAGAVEGARAAKVQEATRAGCVAQGAVHVEPPAAKEASRDSDICRVPRPKRRSTARQQGSCGRRSCRGRF